MHAESTIADTSTVAIAGITLHADLSARCTGKSSGC